MTTTTFKPGDEVHMHADYYEHIWGKGVMTVDKVYPLGTVVCIHPELGRGAFNPEDLTLITPNLEHAFRPGDIVTPMNSKWADYTVVRLTKKGNVVIRDEEGYIQKEAPGNLHLTSRPLNDAEITAQYKQQYDRLLKLTEQEKSNRIAAQYANDQALLNAGLVRVDLLRQWSPTFTERTREPQYALLQRLRSVLAAPNENKEQA